MSDFSDWMQGVAAKTEVALDTALPEAVIEPRHLHAAMRYAVLGGGKRVRPLLVHAAGAFSNAPSAALDAVSCAVEMIHAFSLVHDDMPCMDNDDLRRGRPTVHKAYDDATALLVGDALQAQAFAVLVDADLPMTDGQRVELLAMLAQASGSMGMAGGQAIDIESVGVPLSLETLEAMHRMKTGALLRASIMMGAHCGQAVSVADQQALERYAAAIGLAFQVVDDVLDATADSETLGKTAGKDAAYQKPTYVSVLGLQSAQELAEQLRLQAWEALTECGARAQLLRDMANLIVCRGY